MSVIDKVKVGGTTYDLQDTKAQTEVSDLRSALEYTNNVKMILWEDGCYIPSDTSPVNINTRTQGATWRCALIECQEGDTFTLNITGGGTPLAWVFVTSTGAHISGYKSGYNVTVSDLVITAPENAAYLVLNDKAKSKDSYIGIPSFIKIDELNQKVENVESKVDILIGEIDLGTLQDGYFSATGGISEQTNAYEKYSADYIAVNRTDVLSIGIKLSASKFQWVGWCEYDANKAFLRRRTVEETTQILSQIIAVSQDAYYIRVSFRTYNALVSYKLTYDNLSEKSNEMLSELRENARVKCYPKIIAVAGQTRGYAYIGKGRTKQIVAQSADTNVWFALQGYNTKTYDGTVVYDSGQKTGIYEFAPTNDALYYRIVWGSSSDFTDSQVAGFSCYYICGVSDAVRYSADDIRSEIDIMNENKAENTNIVTIMHGATISYPANTLGLYRTAYASGITYWECDVRPCLDGYVLCHDDDIYNHAVTANGETIQQGTVLIANSTVEQLQTYKFGVITNKQANGIVPGFENDTIPTLQQFLLLAKVYGARPVIEIKFAPTASQMTDICNIIKQFGMLDETYILAYESVANVVQYACENGIKNLSIIIANGTATQSTVDTAYEYIQPYIGQLQDVFFNPTKENLISGGGEIVLYAAQKGMRTCMWTIPGAYDTRIIRNLLNIGCTGFTTNKANVNDIAKTLI